MAKKRLSEKTTEVTVIFEQHVPSSADFKKAYYEKADEIHIENSYEQVEADKKMMEKKPVKEIAADYKRNPEYTEREYKLLKEQIKRGAKVIGTDVWTPEAKNLWEEAMHNPETNERKKAEQQAKAIRIRDEKRLEETIKLLKKAHGKKIVISAGSAHTLFYHKLKKALEEEEKQGKITINRVFASKGKVDANHRVLEKYPPSVQISRIIEFKKGKLTRADEKRIKELIKQEKAFEEEKTKQFLKKLRNKKSVETTKEEATYETLRKLTKAGINQETKTAEQKQPFFKRIASRIKRRR